METPVPSKGLRRKLKRLPVKNKLSQKKLKTAINVSLNSSHTFRSLRMNNHTLALRLETLKKETRAAIDAYQSTLEDNHLLRQKVVSLECIIGDPDSYIEEQINRKLEVYVNGVKSVIQQMQSDVLGLSLNLKSLDEFCSSQNSPVTKNRTSESLQGLDLPAPSLLRYQNEVTNNTFCANESNDDEVDLVSHDLESSCFVARGEKGNLLCEESEPKEQQNMSAVLEQSTLLGDYSTLKSVVEENLHKNTHKDEQISKLPRRVKRSKERKGEATDKDETDFALNHCRKSRRKTHILSADEVNVIGILDVEPPPNLLSSPQLPSSRGDNVEQVKGAEELSNFEKDFPENQDACSNEKSLKKPTSKFPKKLNKAKKQAVPVKGKGQDGLFISNEFILNNLHQKMTEKLSAVQRETAVSSNEIGDMENTVEGDDTVHIVEDMELTMPINVDINIPHLNFKEEIHDLDNNSSEQPNSEEFFPEAVTMQRMKPGQLKFAASRKEVDGSRKSLSSQPPKARSKSKKVIAEMIDKLPQEEAKSIFDFHDKTPTLVSSKEKDMSVFSLRDESSIMSPATPLGRKTHTKTNLLGVESTRNSSHFNEEECTLLGDGVTYSVHLKDGSDNNVKVVGRNSRSRSRSRVSTERSQSKTNDINKEQSGVSQKASNNNTDSSNIQSEISVFGEGSTYSVALHDHSDNCEKVTVRRGRGRSRNRQKSSVNEQQPLECVDNLSHCKQPSMQSEKNSVLGEGMTYSVPVKDASDNRENAVVGNSRSRSQSRTSRARSKNRAKSSADDEKRANYEVSKDGEESNINLENVFALDEGMNRRTLSKEDSGDDDEKVRGRRSRSCSQNRQFKGKSHSRILDNQKSTDSEVFDIGEKSDTNLNKMSLLSEGITYSVALKDDSDDSKKVTVRKSRGRSRSRVNEESLVDASENNRQARSRSRRRTHFQWEEDFDLIDLHRKERNDVELNDQKAIKNHSGMPLESPVKEVPDSDAVEVNRQDKNSLSSRKRARPKLINADKCIDDNTDEVEKLKTLNSEETEINSPKLKKTPTKSIKKLLKSIKKHGKCEAQSDDAPLSLQDDFTATIEKKNATVRTELCSQSIKKESIHGEKVTDSKSTYHLDEMSVLGEGITYSVALKDDSDDSKKTTVRKSRGRSRSRVNEESLVDASENNRQARSRSRRRTHVQFEEDFDLIDIHRKERNDVKLNDQKAIKNHSGKPLESPVKEVPDSDTVEVNRQDKNSLSSRKRARPKLINADKCIVDDTDEVEKLKTINSPKLKKTPTKSNKKLLKSIKKHGKCEAQSDEAPLSLQDDFTATIEKKNATVRSELCSQSTEKEIIQDGLRVTDSKSTSDSTRANSLLSLTEIESNEPSEHRELCTSLDIQNKFKVPEMSEKSSKRLGDCFAESDADAVFKSSEILKGHRKKRRDPNANFEECERQIQSLKNLYTPESFKEKTQKGPCSPSVSSSSQSQASSLVQRSASEETNLDEESFGESSRRRRAASKCVSYAEPSLGGKLRRGDPFTSFVGGNKIPVYKSPKAGKKKKEKRNAFRPLQNCLMEGETSQ